MKPGAKNINKLQAELAELKIQLEEATETIEAIRTGQVDALVVEDAKGHQLYTLKSADLAYRVFIENMSEGAVTLNPQGIILYSNQQFATMVQTPLSGVIGHSFQKFIATEMHDTVLHLLCECWAADCKGEVALQTPGNAMPVQLSLTKLEMEEGITLSIIITDLTSQKKTQQQLQATNQQLAQINRDLEVSNHDLQQFASVASHDLQEPLRKIQMFANLLKERSGASLAPEATKYVNKIIGSSGRMKALIVDVLSYSKLSAKNTAFEPIELSGLVNDLLEDFELIIQEKGVDIQVDELPAVEGNRGQVRQLFQNLISNAIKFSRPGHPPKIKLTSRRLKQKAFDSKSQPDGRFCAISVKDNGIGFDEKYLSQIFALFERLHAKDAYEGTGIGLAITKKIIEKHNGLITAKSSVGNGAEFIFILPVTQPKSTP